MVSKCFCIHKQLYFLELVKDLFLFLIEIEPIIDEFPKITVDYRFFNDLIFNYFLLDIKICTN